MINHSTVKDSNGRRGAKSGHDLEEEAAEAAREEEMETAPEAGRQGATTAGRGQHASPGRGAAAAAEGGLAWRATATGEHAEAA